MAHSPIPHGNLGRKRRPMHEIDTPKSLRLIADRIHAAANQLEDDPSNDTRLKVFNEMHRTLRHFDRLTAWILQPPLL